MSRRTNKLKSTVPKTAIQIIDSAIKILEQHSYLSPLIQRVSDEQVFFRYGLLIAFDSDDGIKRVQVMAFLNCPRQILLILGKALSDFILLERRCPSLLKDSGELLNCETATIEYCKARLLPYCTSKEKKVLENISRDVLNECECDMDWDKSPEKKAID